MPIPGIVIMRYENDVMYLQARAITNVLVLVIALESHLIQGLIKKQITTTTCWQSTCKNSQISTGINTFGDLVFSNPGIGSGEPLVNNANQDLIRIAPFKHDS